MAGGINMTRIIMHGCMGRMGTVIEGLLENDQEAAIVAGVDIIDNGNKSYPVFTAISKFDALLDYAVEKKLPVVLCTTGLSTEQLDKMREASKTVPILKSANMSLGINTIMKLLKVASNVFVPAGFDVEIVEHHHNQKLDAPSGTALALADSINEACGGQFEYVYDRSDRMQKRDKKELGISAVRAGTIPGTHEIIFAGPDEYIEIKHVAYSRSIFANGAISAAKFLSGKSAGIYDMSDVIASY